MVDRDTERLVESVQAIASLLARKQYEAATKACVTSRLSSIDISHVVEEYGCQLAIPPEDAYINLDAVRIRNSAEPSWSVRAPMWTVEEGRSDLTLELTITYSGKEAQIELDDFHVL